MEIDRSGPNPIYKQLVEWMRLQILSEEWPDHHKLIAEIDLAADLGVSRGTLRKAIGELIAAGMLVQVHGRGTFVTSNALEQPLAERLVAFSEDLIERGIRFETQVLEQALILPPLRVASLLSLPPGGEVFFLKRVRTVKHQPVILLENYVASDKCPGIEQFDFQNHRLFEVLEERFQQKLEWGRRTFEARVAQPETAELLKIEPGDPVMYIEQVTYAEKDSPVELSDLWLRADHYRISAVVKRDGARQITGGLKK